MNKLLYIVLIATFLFSMSCSDSLDNSSALVQFTPEEQATAYLGVHQNKILFAAINVNHTTNDLKGYLVDNKANLRQIEMTNAANLNFDIRQMHEVDVDKLFENSEIVSQLDILETSEMYKASKRINTQAELNISEDKNESKIYVSYSLNANSSDEHAGCGDGASYSDMPAYNIFNQNHLQSFGKINYEINDSNNSLVLNWLQSFEQELGD